MIRTWQASAISTAMTRGETLVPRCRNASHERGRARTSHAAKRNVGTLFSLEVARGIAGSFLATIR